MQRILITGIDGFVGRHVARALAQVGHELHGLTRSAGSSSVDVAQLHRVDLLDFDGVRRCISAVKPDVVVHLAGVRPPAAQRTEMVRVNVLGTASLLSGLESSPSVRVVHASSAAVYGPVPQPSYPLAEDTVSRPATAYGASKAAAEILVRQFADRRATTVILRLGNVIGPGQPRDLAASAFAIQIVRAERSKCPGVLRHGRLDDVRDFVDVRDVAAAVLRSIDMETEATATYNIATGRAVRLSQVIDILVSAAGVQMMSEIDPDLATGGFRGGAALDIRSFSQKTGWTPTIDLARSLRDTLDYWRQIE